MSGEPGCLERLRPKYRDSGAVLEEYGHWEAPDENEAREGYLKSHAHHGVFELTCPNKDLKEFGEGVQMYFFLLKHIGIMFCVLAFLPGLLLAVFNGLGGWYDEADIERTMLGNYGLLTFNGAGSGLNITTSGITSRSVSSEGAVTALFTSTVDSRAAKAGGMNKRSLLVAMSVLDLVGVVFFFCYGVAVMLVVRARSARADLSATTIKEYSVRVDNLPPDASAPALKDYLTAAAGEGAEIVQVELCRCVDALLGLVVERGQVVQESELALAVVQRKAETSPRVPESLIVDLLYSRFLLEGITATIRQEQAYSKTNEVVAAFVTFSTPEGRQRLQQALPSSLVKQWRLKPEQKFNNGGIGGARIKPVALNISQAPEPADILYENLEYTRLERMMRAIATNTAKFLVLLLGFLLVSLAPAIRTGMSGLKGGPSTATCSASCTYKDGAGNYVLSASNRTLYKECDPVAGTGALPNKLDCEGLSVCYECYCRAALNAGSYGQVLYCDRFSSVMGIYTLAQVLAVVGVVIANFLIELAITWLVRQEKHHTRTREAVGITRGLFINTLVNTAFSNLVANMYLPGPAAVISGSFLSGYIFTGAFSDTTPNWYHDVCRPITISLFLTTIIVHLKVAFRWWWRRRCLASRYQCLTQWQLEEAYEGHQFELAIKYGQHLYVIYVAMLYSSGVPLLYMLAAVHFATCYWSEKYELLRLCRRPLTYSRDLAVYFSSSVPFAALWHLAFGIWFFSLFGLPKSPLMAAAFRRSLSSSVSAFKKLMPVASALSPQLVAWRFTQNSSAHLFLGFIALGGGLFIYFTTSTWLALMRGLAKQLGLISASDAPASATNVPEFNTAVRSQLLVGPASYAVQQNPAYVHAFVRMEELEWEARKEMEAKVAADALAWEAGADPSAAAAASAASASEPPTSRRKRTAANRLRAKQRAAAAMAATAAPGAGWSAAGGGGGVLPSNKVAPAPAPQAPPLPPQPAQQQPQPALSSGSPVVVQPADAVPAPTRAPGSQSRPTTQPTANPKHQTLMATSAYGDLRVESARDEEGAPQSGTAAAAAATPGVQQPPQPPPGGVAAPRPGVPAGQSGRTRGWAELDLS